MKYALFGEALVFPLSGASPNRKNNNLNLVCIQAGRERGGRAPPIAGVPPASPTGHSLLVLSC